MQYNNIYSPLRPKYLSSGVMSRNYSLHSTFFTCNFQSSLNRYYTIHKNIVNIYNYKILVLKRSVYSLWLLTVTFHYKHPAFKAKKSNIIYKAPALFQTIFDHNRS